MKNYIFLLLLIALTSCSSFDRMKYRHLNKVPATPQEFSAAENKSVPGPDTIAASETNAICTISAAAISYDTNAGAAQELNVSPIRMAGIPPEAILSPAGKIKSKSPGAAAPIKRDWSLLIGALLIISGLLMLALCIFYFPAAGISFLWVIAFELASLYAAWRMIGTGVMYFITRFRRKRNFSER